MSRIGVPYFLTQHQPDVDYVIPFDVEVRADLADEPGWSPLLPLYEAAAEAVAADVAAGECPAVITGDCTVALGTVAGLQRGGLDPGIVWFDAHGDVQTLETSTSGYLGGLPLRLLAGYRPELIADAIGLRAVPEDRIVLAGARDLDPPEVQYLAGAAIRRRQVTDLTEADLPDGPLYVHLDVDVLDPGGLPGLILPVPGGPGTAQVGRALCMLRDTGRVAAVGIACTWHAGQGAAAHVRSWLEDTFEGS